MRAGKNKWNRPMMKHNDGDLNQIAKNRAGRFSNLNHPNFGEIRRVGIRSGRLVRDKGGVKTYVYG